MTVLKIHNIRETPEVHVSFGLTQVHLFIKTSMLDMTIFITLFKPLIIALVGNYYFKARGKLV